MKRKSVTLVTKAIMVMLEIKVVINVQMSSYKAQVIFDFNPLKTKRVCFI
jgi:hypothetical protein